MTNRTDGGEQLLTKFLILERVEATHRDLSADPTPGDGDSDAAEPSWTGPMWKPVGDQLARDRDQALRLFLGDPVREIEGDYVAVSENAWKPRTVSIKPAIKLTEATS